MKPKEVCTTCPYCGVGCGVKVTVNGDQVTVSGDENHPANFGRLCVKGSSLGATINNPDRLLKPRVNNTDTSWDDAIAHVATKLQRIIAQHGPDAVGFYLSGQLTTEDYYVANKLMKGFIGSGNVDTNSRLCMASAVAAHKRAFGEDLVPACYEDLEQADLIILTGSNMAYTHPVIFQRIVAAKQKRPELYIAVLDPRRTATCEMADQHLALAPGSDGFFFNGLLAYLADHQHLDQAFINQHTEGFAQALASARAQTPSVEEAAARCDVDKAALHALYQRFANTEKVVTLFSQGINQSATGTDKGNAIINCHLATGKIGKPGAAPFSITGQPNAMGGREVGGMANTLAAHRVFEHPDDQRSVAQFWQAPSLATGQGLKAVEMMEAAHAGKIKALWIMATNPVVSMPDANFVREALQRCELVIVSDCYGHTDTAQLADVLFPACTWGEKTGTVTNAERRISLQKAFLPAPEEAKPDWQIISHVAQAMGFTDAFDYQHPADIFREHAALSGYNNAGERAFNISEHQHISTDEYLALQPFQWPNNQQRLFADQHFFTASGKAAFIPIQAIGADPLDSPEEVLLNTGRLRDQWHTMTRTGPAAVLFSHIKEPFAAIHPQDANRFGVKDGGLVQLHNRQGKLIARAHISSEQRPGEIFMPIHWSDSYSASARVSSLIQRLVDPISGQPQYKQTAVKLHPIKTMLEGSLLLHDSVDTSWRPDCNYWSRATLKNGSQYFLAETELDQSALLASKIQQQFATIKVWLMFSSQVDQGLSVAGFIDDRLMLVLHTAATAAHLPDASAIEPWLGQTVAMNQRFPLLSGEGQAYAAKGPIICSCYQVGQFEIETSVEEGNNTIETLGAALQCGTNCGSCVPELKQLIGRHTQREDLLSE